MPVCGSPTRKRRSSPSAKVWRGTAQLPLRAVKVKGAIGAGHGHHVVAVAQQLQAALRRLQAVSTALPTKRLAARSEPRSTAPGKPQAQPGLPRPSQILQQGLRASRCRRSRWRARAPFAPWWAPQPVQPSPALAGRPHPQTAPWRRAAHKVGGSRCMSHMGTKVCPKMCQRHRGWLWGKCR